LLGQVGISMQASSPWFSLYRFAPPNFPFCGVMTSGWDVDPIDTYSSVFYLIAGFILLKMAKRSPPAIRNIAYIPFVLTIGSILFHMSFTYVFLIADFIGIFYLSCYGISLNLSRLGVIDASKIVPYSFVGTLIWSTVMAIAYPLKIHSGLFMVPLLVTFLSSEWLCSKKHPEVNYRDYAIAVFMCSVGYICMLLEGPPFRLGCHPGQFFQKLQLHALWHFLSAAMMIFVFRFYNQKPIIKSLLKNK